MQVESWNYEHHSWEEYLTAKSIRSAKRQIALAPVGRYRCVKVLGQWENEAVQQEVIVTKETTGVSEG